MDTHHYRMGIRGLLKLVQKCKSEYYFKPDLTRQILGLNTTIIAIDASSIMYKARGSGLSIVTVFAHLIVRMRVNQIEPVVVFDGRTPKMKEHEITKRREYRESIFSKLKSIETELSESTSSEQTELLQKMKAEFDKKAPRITGNDRDQLKQLFHASSVRFITASEEADDFLAWGSRKGFFDAVISNDLDMLPRGVKHLILPETADVTVLSSLFLSDVLKEFDESFESFVNRCIRMGTDFTGCSSHEQIVARFQGSGSSLDSLLSPKQKEKWETAVGESEPELLEKFCNENRWPKGWIHILGHSINEI